MRRDAFLDTLVQIVIVTLVLVLATMRPMSALPTVHAQQLIHAVVKQVFMDNNARHGIVIIKCITRQVLVQEDNLV